MAATHRDDPAGASTEEIQQLRFRDVAAILRCVDAWHGEGGRGRVAQVLKGSRNRGLLERGIQNCPVYAYFRDLTTRDIMARIDWVIDRGFLTTEHRGRTPKLVYTMRGWDIEKETLAAELVRGFDELLATGLSLFNMNYLCERSPELLDRVLDKVLDKKDPKYLPILEAWLRVAPDSIRRRLGGVITELRKAG